jgi:hypothetical protein
MDDKTLRLYTQDMGIKLSATKETAVKLELLSTNRLSWE